MKKYSWIIPAALFLLTACQTNANDSLHWKADGTVTGVSGKKAKLDIQGIYDSLDYSGFNYLAGFKIDKEGNNFPHIVQISNDASSVKYWPFDKIPNDIFIYQKNVQIITTEGSIYTLQDDKWNLTDKKFPRDSQIVYSDTQDGLIVCHPASMEKTGDYNSGCFSTNNNWRLDFIWFTAVPKVCNGKLYVVEETGESKVVKHIDLTTGKILQSNPVKNLPEDICSLYPGTTH